MNDIEALMAALDEAKTRHEEAKAEERRARSAECNAQNAVSAATKALAKYLNEHHPEVVRTAVESRR